MFLLADFKRFQIKNLTLECLLELQELRFDNLVDTLLTKTGVLWNRYRMMS